MTILKDTHLESYLSSIGKRAALAKKNLSKRLRLADDSERGYQVVTYAEAMQRFAGKDYVLDYRKRRWTSSEGGSWSFEDFGKECLTYYHFLIGTTPPTVAKIKAAKRKPSFVVKTLQGPDCARDFIPPKKPAELTEALYLAVVAKWGKGKRTEIQSFACWQQEKRLNIYSKSRGYTTISIDGGFLRRSTEGAWGREEITYYEVS